ncbi:hypothetical protein ACFLVX_05075 [Chloroflexota bacterium]
MAQQSNLKEIKQALSVGRLTIPEPATGYHRSFYARCPNDSEESSVYRIEKHGEAITQVVFRCPLCSQQFDAAPKDMLLR